jgi:ABC-type hemin transport system substrate-binding protein
MTQSLHTIACVQGSLSTVQGNSNRLPAILNHRDLLVDPILDVEPDMVAVVHRRGRHVTASLMGSAAGTA